MELDEERRTGAFDALLGTLISGYAALFHSEAVIAGEFRERLAPGCFAKTLKENDVLALLHHDSGRVLGRTSAGTLMLREDAKGLWFELDADPTTPEGQTALGTVRRQDIRGCSFGFRVLREDWEETRGLPLRTILEVDLYEITLTAAPAYAATTATVGHRATDAVGRTRHKAEAAMAARGL